AAEVLRHRAEGLPPAIQMCDAFRRPPTAHPARTGQTAHRIPSAATASRAFYQAASDPKKLNWYDTGHDVDSIAAMSDRAKFLANALGLKEINRGCATTSGNNSLETTARLSALRFS